MEGVLTAPRPSPATVLWCPAARPSPRSSPPGVDQLQLGEPPLAPRLELQPPPRPHSLVEQGERAAPSPNSPRSTRLGEYGESCLLWILEGSSSRQADGTSEGWRDTTPSDQVAERRGAIIAAPRRLQLVENCGWAGGQRPDRRHLVYDAVLPLLRFAAESGAGLASLAASSTGGIDRCISFMAPGSDSMPRRASPAISRANSCGRCFPA